MLERLGNSSGRAFDMLFELAKLVTQPLDSCFMAVFLITSYELDGESSYQRCYARIQRASFP